MVKCSICLKEYETTKERDMCSLSHEIIYVPLTKSELNRLINFIMTGESRLLTSDLTKKLFKFASKGNND